MSTPKAFWKWFKDNHHYFEAHPMADKDNLYFDLQLRLNNYCPNLGFAVVGPTDENEKYKLIITTKESRGLTIKAAYLISKAPKIKGWRFIASIRPMQDLSATTEAVDTEYQFQNFKVKISDLFFLPNLYCIKSKKFNITIYLQDYWQYPKELLRQAVTMMLEDLLGERLTYSKINKLTISQLPNITEHLMPIADMETFFDNFDVIE